MTEGRDEREAGVKLRVSPVNEPLDAGRWINVLPRTLLLLFFQLPNLIVLGIISDHTDLHSRSSHDDRGICFAVRPDALLRAPLGQRE